MYHIEYYYFSSMNYHMRHVSSLDYIRFCFCVFLLSAGESRCVCVFCICVLIMMNVVKMAV